MHTVLLTPTFESDAEAAGLSDEEIQEIVVTIAADPLAGALMVGTGGVRKLRHGAHGKGKSGGVRSIHYFGGGDIPVFLLALYRKGDRDNLSPRERAYLAKVLPMLVSGYGKSE